MKSAIVGVLSIIELKNARWNIANLHEKLWKFMLSIKACFCVYPRRRL